MLPSANHPYNCGNFTSQIPASAWAKQAISGRPFDLFATKSVRVVGPASDLGQFTVTSFGAVVRRSQSESSVDDVIVELKPTGATGTYGNTTVRSESPGVITGSSVYEENAGGFSSFAYQGDGTAIIEAEAADGYKGRVAIGVSTGGATQSDVWVDYSGTAANNLGKHLESQVSARTGSVDIFSTMNHAAGIYVRNPSFWLSDVDFTCFSPWNSREGQNRAGTLISPQFLICAEHYRLEVGDTVRFVGPAGQVVNRTVAASSVTSGGFDVFVVKLNQPITEHITPCKVLPKGIISSGIKKNAYRHLPTAYLNALNAAGDLFLSYLERPLPPAITTNQDKKAGLALTQGLSYNWIGAGASPGLDMNKPGRIYRQSLDIQPLIRSGCSGSPVFLLINGQLCLAGERYYLNTTGTCFTSELCYDGVQAAMNAMGSVGNDQLTPADLSQFTTFD